MVLPPGVARACVVLFGIEPARVSMILAQLQPDQLKAAFNQRAMQFHPDRAAALGVDASVLTERFRLMRQARDTLAGFLEDPAGAASTLARDHWNAEVPARSLRLGEYLYFTGWLPWSTVARGMEAQARRPSFGATAVGLGLLRKVDAEQLELRRLSRERLGDCAVRLGKLTPAQRDCVVTEQRRRTLPLGECLVRLGLMLPHELAHMVAAQQAHNAACADPFARWAA